MSLINVLRKIKKKRQIKLNREYLKIDNNVQLKEWFSFRIDKKKSGNIYLSIGEYSVISGQYITETEDAFIKIGKRCFINDGTNIISAANIEIGDDVNIAWDVTIYDSDGHSINWDERKEDIYCNFGLQEKNWNVVAAKPIKINDKAWIGFGATILKGVEIGEGAIVAAKSVVTKDVEPFTVVAGNPARVVKKL